MSAPASTPALLLLSLPPSLLVGIDLITFTTSPRFLGVKDLPAGWHFLYTSETTSYSIRDGFWFHIPASPPSLIVRKWDPASSSLIPCTTEEHKKATGSLREIWRERLTPYRQSAGTDTNWRITSASCSPQDADHIPGLSASETGLEERELQFLGIDLKRTWREGAVGRERTEAVLDRSWALGEVEERFNSEKEGGGDVVVGEMEVCFLMVLTVANYSCLEEWKRILGLVLTCRRAVRAREGWFAAFLRLLRMQLERGGDVEGGLFDMNDEGGAYLKALLKGFKIILGQVFGEGEGEGKGMLELEDGEQIEMEVEDMEGEDERGEYAPVIVEL
ncbi:40S ribosomal protein S16 [Physcia stellaris]|nr:40S ribosomal protein S16 [Physcia stellaris]